MMNDPRFTQPRASLDLPATDLHLNPQALPGSGPAPPVTLAPSDHTDRDAFSLRLQQHYHRYAVNETPFMLIALRGDGPAARSLDFALLYACAEKLFTAQDDWLVHLPNRRLIVLLNGGRPDDARRFFARLKLRLLEAAPDEAERYLHAVAAITLPNGAPFQTAEEFLTVALEEG